MVTVQPVSGARAQAARWLDRTARALGGPAQCALVRHRRNVRLSAARGGGCPASCGPAWPRGKAPAPLPGRPACSPARRAPARCSRASSGRESGRRTTARSVAPLVRPDPVGAACLAGHGVLGAVLNQLTLAHPAQGPQAVAGSKKTRPAFGDITNIDAKPVVFPPEKVRRSAHCRPQRMRARAVCRSLLLPAPALGCYAAPRWGAAHASALVPTAAHGPRRRAARGTAGQRLQRRHGRCALRHSVASARAASAALLRILLC